MSLDMTAGTRSPASPVTPEAADEPAAAASRLWLYEVMLAGVAAFGAVLTSVAAVLLYLR